MKLLEEEGVAFRLVDYYQEPFTRASLEALLKKAGLSPRDVLRKRAPQYQDLGLAEGSLDDDALLDAIVQHPDLLARPIAQRGDRAVLARPAEAVRTLL